MKEREEKKTFLNHFLTALDINVTLYIFKIGFMIRLKKCPKRGLLLIANSNCCFYSRTGMEAAACLGLDGTIITSLQPPNSPLLYVT